MTRGAWVLTAAIAVSSCTVTLPGDGPRSPSPVPAPVSIAANRSNSAAPVAQGQVVADLALAGPAYAVALDTARQRIFVRLADAVQIFDSSTLQQIASIPVPDGNQWTGLAFDDFLGYLWVPSWSGTVTLIAAGGAPRSAATFPVGLNPGPVAVDRRTHYAYVVCMGREALHDDTFGETWVMDPNAAGPRARIPAGGFPMSVTANAAANRAYVAVRNPNPAASSFVQVIGAGPDDIREITTIGTSPVVSLVTDERTNRMYATSGAPAPLTRGFITTIDGRTVQATTFVALPAGASTAFSSVLGIDASRGHVYLGASDGELAIATERDDMQLNYAAGAQYSIASQPTGIAVDEARHRVYVVTYSQRLVVLRDDWP